MLYDENFQLIPFNSNYIQNKEYYIQDKFEVVWVPKYPERKYVTEKDYEYFKDKAFLYSSNAYIDSRNINLDVNNYTTGQIGKINSLQTDIGVYCELFYQISKIEYNISKSVALKTLKEQLDLYDYYLSKDYFLEQCYYNNNEENYIAIMAQVREGYKTLYFNYLTSLDNYLKKLELEG